MKQLRFGPSYCGACSRVPSCLFSPQPLHIILWESLTLVGILLRNFDKKREAAQRELEFENMLPKTWKTPNLFNGPKQYMGPKDFGYIWGKVKPSPTQSMSCFRTMETAGPLKSLKYGKPKSRSGRHHTTSQNLSEVCSHEQERLK